MNDNDSLIKDSKVTSIRVTNQNEEFYTIDDLINNPLSIYGIFWTVKNMMMYLAGAAEDGDDVTEDLKFYYNSNANDKEEYDIKLIKHIHQLMANTIKELATYPDCSVDNMIAETLTRFKRK